MKLDQPFRIQIENPEDHFGMGTETYIETADELAALKLQESEKFGSKQAIVFDDCFRRAIDLVSMGRVFSMRFAIPYTEESGSAYSVYKIDLA